MQGSVGLCNATGELGHPFTGRLLTTIIPAKGVMPSQRQEGPAASRQRTVTASASAAGTCSHGAVPSAVLSCSSESYAKSRLVLHHRGPRINKSGISRKCNPSAIHVHGPNLNVTSGDAKMDEMKAELGARALPEQLFLDSGLRLTHEASGASLELSALGSLRQWHAAALPPVQVPFTCPFGSPSSFASSAVAQHLVDPTASA